MVTFIMAVGIAGSGKDYLYAHHYLLQPEYKDLVMVSSDNIRETIFGDINDQAHNKEVFEIMRQQALKLLKQGISVYYNATNLSSKRRINFLKEVSKIPNVKKICALNVPPFEKVKERNAGRIRKVPEEVIEKMLRKFQPPHQSEGWDEIEVFGKDMDGQKTYDIVATANKIPHDNPNHTLTIGKHMYQAYFYGIRQGLPLDVCEAALCHDVGKPHCKSFYDYRGRKTRKAHYYSHDSVGAYIYLSHSNGLEQDITVANLIAHHMDFFKGEKCLTKIKNQYGEEFYKKLEQLHEADINAH